MRLHTGMSSPLGPETEAVKSRTINRLGRPSLAHSPCDECQHAKRCKAGEACSALALWLETGRIIAAAPREPSRKRFQRLFG